MPEIDHYQLNLIPADSEDVRKFMKYSIPPQNQFWFNYVSQVQLECGKYYEELKSVARRTLLYFSVCNTNFTDKEFCEVVAAAKFCKNLYLWYNNISLDSDCDFGTDMDDCKIEYIDLSYSGAMGYSDWARIPERFENLIAAIAKCEQLSKSLKSICIAHCNVTKDKSQEIMTKYNLNEIQITGV